MGRQLNPTHHGLKYQFENFLLMYNCLYHMTNVMFTNDLLPFIIMVPSVSLNGQTAKSHLP